MEQLVIAAPPDGSIGVLLRAYRHWALLSQEQLAARAGLSERTVRDLEADRVRTPHTDTIAAAGRCAAAKRAGARELVGGRPAGESPAGHARARRPRAAARQRPRPAVW